MKAIVVEEAGGPEVLKIKDIPRPSPRDGWVLIKVKGFGLNRSELMTRQGHSGDAVPFPRVLGIECVGEVVDAPGTDLQSGQKVAAAMGEMGRQYDGGYAEYTLVPRSQVMAVETSLSWAEFAAIPETYFTAWGVVVEAMGVQPGQTILVRAGTSSVGRAAINILKDMNCTVIATSRSEQKRKILLESGVDHVIITQVNTAAAVREISPMGVNGVVELVGTQETIMDSLQACAPRGVVGMVGVLGYEWEYNWFPWMPSTVHLTMYSSATVETNWGTSVLQEIVKRMEQGRYRSSIHQQFSFDEVVEAHRMMEENRASGKLVVTLD